MTNLKRIIDEKGISQKWLAEQIGVTEVSMSRYISGERIPKAPIAIRMADVLGVDVKELYGWDDEHVVGESEQPETHEKRTETHGVCLDTINRQAALDWLKNEWNGMVTSLFDGINELPSAQPDSKETSSTHKVLDTISRQAVIDALNRIGSLDTYADREYAESIFEEIPSAQPIIRCKDCKHQVKEWRADKRLKDKGYMVCGCDVVGDACGYWALLGQDDDFCSYAERRTDG